MSEECNVELVGITKIANKKMLEKLSTDSAEELIMYCARVSNPQNQDSGNPKLLNYCAKKQHWSIFEMANLSVEIKTSRAIAQQILRHRSFSFQEFSQRYAKVQDHVEYSARRQDNKNRQNSIDDLDEETQRWFRASQEAVWGVAQNLYDKAIDEGIAKECARFLLPVSAASTLYMNGTVRSWIHYIQLRTGHGTQKEHMDIANKIKDIFCEQFPIIAEALEWR